MSVFKHQNRLARESVNPLFLEIFKSMIDKLVWDGLDRDDAALNRESD